MANDVCMYGLAAEFKDSDGLLKAARAAKKAGYQRVEAFSPYYVEGLGKTLGYDFKWLGWVLLAGLIIGGLGGYYLQWVTEVLSYPLNIGGRPFNSWPAFMPITFELAILVAGLGVGGALLIRAGLPLPYHPAFNTPNFEKASSEAFFLCIEVTDNRFDLNETRLFLQGLGPVNVSEVSC
jgi:hypothetical protein